MAPKMPDRAHLSLFLHDVCCKDYPKPQYRSLTPRLIDRSAENLYQRSLETLEPVPPFSDEGDLMCNLPLIFQ